MRDQRRNLGLLLGGLLVCAVPAGCEGPAPGNEVIKPKEPDLLRSDVPRDLMPQASTADIKALTAGNAEFSLDLYQKIRGKNENLFYSPHSISQALAMTYAGARGETARQMAQVLHFTLPDDRLHAAWNALDLELMGRGKGQEGTDDMGFRLRVVNSLFGQKGYRFLDPFLDLLSKNYGAGMRLVEFEEAPDAARLLINEWVKAQTEGRIPDLLPDGSIKPETRLVLANAIYFNAAWTRPFKEADTTQAPFTLLDNKSVQVPMMSQEAEFDYGVSGDVKAVSLPYGDGKLSMVILLPEPGKLAQVEAGLTPARVDSVMKSMSRTNLLLKLPKFKFDARLNLKETLISLGMKDAFTDHAADFSGMDGTRRLVIFDVLHKAFIAVNEKGTEAAAATGVVVGVVSAPPPPVPLTIDRPFLFFIRDNPTGAVLFQGRVVNPG